MSGKSQYEIEIKALLERIAVGSDAPAAADSFDSDIQERIAVSNEAIQVANETIAAAATAFQVTYTFPLIDLDTGDVTRDIQGPAGLRGTVVEVNLYDVSELFTDDTTEARLDVGIQGGDDNAYTITDDVGTLGADAALSLGLTPGVVGTIPAAEDILLTFVAPTGGTPEGIATWSVTISWFV